MNSSLLHLARPAVRAMKAYTSARSITSEGRIFLDANESPDSNLAGMNRYPEPQPRDLVEAFAKLYAVSRENVLVGRGSDEAIDLLVRAFCEAGRDRILITPPTYGVYEIAAALQGADVVRVPLIRGESFELDEAAILSRALNPENRIKLVFLCAPNNPTGTGFERAALLRICEALSDRVLVVVDEAYSEFSEIPSVASEIGGRPNLVVLRTLSKAWAIAGARCGTALANPELISLLQKVRAPYPMSTPAIDVIRAAISEPSREKLAQRVALLKSERDLLGQSLRTLPAVEQVYPSQGNFLLARFKDKAQLLLQARERGIVLRDRSGEAGLEGCVRITVGSPAENQEVLTLVEALS